MEVRSLEEAEAFTTADGSTIRELHGLVASSARGQSLAEATAIANREQDICRDTEDFREGIAHYLEKRKPNFTGR